MSIHASVKRAAATALMIGFALCCPRIANGQGPADSLLAVAQAEGRAAAGSEIASLYAMVGAAGGFFLGAFLADLPRDRSGDGDYQLKLVGIGTGVLIGASVAARHMPSSYDYDGPPELRSAAIRAYEAELRKRRQRRLVAGTAVGVFAGWLVYAYAGGGT